ncbi:MAG: hypothetical protein ACREIC_14640 [Limisphaerales bacterium]
MSVSAGGQQSPLLPQGAPVITELNKTDLGIIQPLQGGGVFKIVCREASVTFTAVDRQARPLSWAWELVGGERQKSAVRQITSGGISYHFNGVGYELRLSHGAGSCQPLDDGDIRLNPNDSGKLVLNLAQPR